MAKKLILCDCLGSQNIDAETLSSTTGMRCDMVLSDACGSQIETMAKTMGDGDVMVACQQQARLFSELADELGATTPAFVDIRDRAGWTATDQHPTPKMAALLAEAALGHPAEKTLDIQSHGACLVIGGSDAARKAAEDLSSTLAVTLLVPAPTDADAPGGIDRVAGQLHRAQGTLGQFSLRIDRFQQVIAGGRGTLAWTDPKDGAVSECDIILDLSGGQPLFPAPEKRDGYLRADPGSGPAVAEAVLKASQMIGTFEKPLYVRLEEPLCAHSRAEKPACSKCLDICPTGAITSAGEHVAIDPLVCAGCGACSALCPSGAITYDAPPVGTIFNRMHTLASTYRAAGGTAPRLLLHDADFGSEMISLAARFGRGLPADVIPMAVPALAGFGHAEMLAALATGFAQVDILLSPKTERDVIAGEAALAVAICGQEAIRLLDVSDPDALSDTLYGASVAAPVAEPVLPIGTRRQVTRLAAKALQPDAEVLRLPAAAPYGAIVVDQNACTLCLSCVSLCPSGALGDNPDNPQLRFQEDACLQCGLCSNICPEDAITLTPQLDLTDAAFTQKVLHEEEPFACIECGSLFGVKSTVERITEKLAGNHAMFSSPETIRMIQMCDNCRIAAQYHSENNPFASKDRPRVRTTDDYLSKRRDH
ncbi:MAG: 4Fe-4S binding protein [Pseudomonadota bacterium]